MSDIDSLFHPSILLKNIKDQHNKLIIKRQNIKRYQKEYHNKNSKFLHLKSLYQKSIEECEDELKLIEKALKVCADKEYLNDQANESIENNLIYHNEGLRRGHLMYLIDYEAKNLPVISEHKLPPLCGSLPPVPNYVAQPGDKIAAYIKGLVPLSKPYYSDINIHPFTSEYNKNTISLSTNSNRHIVKTKKLIKNANIYDYFVKIPPQNNVSKLMNINHLNNAKSKYLKSGVCPTKSSGSRTNEKINLKNNRTKFNQTQYGIKPLTINLCNGLISNDNASLTPNKVLEQKMSITPVRCNVFNRKNKNFFNYSYSLPNNFFNRDKNNVSINKSSSKSISVLDILQRNHKFFTFEPDLKHQRKAALAAKITINKTLNFYHSSTSNNFPPSNRYTEARDITREIKHSKQRKRGMDTYQNSHFDLNIKDSPANKDRDPVLPRDLVEDGDHDAFNDQKSLPFSAAYRDVVLDDDEDDYKRDLNSNSFGTVQLEEDNVWILAQVVRFLPNHKINNTATLKFQAPPKNSSTCKSRTVPTELRRYDHLTPGSYEIIDVDDHERYMVSSLNVIPLPKYRANDPASHPEAFYKHGTHVLARYPQTTCFYKALVQEIDPQKFKLPKNNRENHYMTELSKRPGFIGPRYVADKSLLSVPAVVKNRAKEMSDKNTIISTCASKSSHIKTYTGKKINQKDDPYATYSVIFEDPLYPDGYSPPLQIPQKYVILFKNGIDNSKLPCKR